MNANDISLLAFTVESLIFTDDFEDFKKTAQEIRKTLRMNPIGVDPVASESFESALVYLIEIANDLHKENYNTTPYERVELLKSKLNDIDYPLRGIVDWSIKNSISITRSRS
jgi:hypothetical protein